MRQLHNALLQEGVISELEKRLEDKLGLSACLIKPTQRMVKYKQFLDIMLANTEVGQCNGAKCS